ncbi:hypothetical protein JOD54_006676 [Actinokineospora baliensis]|uniref:hypothetical protein n=1 Tax=Actinokineospora baliensis TaxID=547056 RepID=UPI001959BFD4|nr:hypothetical protein [Actinokineospora baliensis]MBM7776472.1 hypothetical protein [Actinokineospora baliensis]
MTRLAAAALLLLITACGTAAPEKGPAMPTKSGTGALRTDLEPLTKRFPALSSAEAAQWMSGTLGDDRVPGPSTYWIDAIVTVPESLVAKVSQGTREEAEAPAVVEGLREHLPAGPYLTGPALDDAFSNGGWSATAYLAKGTNTVVLVAKGQ